MITLATIIPVLRSSISSEADRLYIIHSVAVRFQSLSWIAFGVIVLSGIWNLTYIELNGTTLVEFSTKMGFVVLSAVSAALHSFVFGRNVRVATQAGENPKLYRALSGVSASLALLFALLALVYGVVLST